VRRVELCDKLCLGVIVDAGDCIQEFLLLNLVMMLNEGYS